MNKKCLNCDKDFSKPYSASMKSWIEKYKYCSKDCYTYSMKGKDLLKLNRYSGIPWNKGKKYSMPKNTRVIKICIDCKTPFTVRSYRKDIAKFCSHECASKNRNFGLTPKNEAIRKSAAYKAWRTLVFERDDYTCQICFIRGGKLHADHIKPFAYNPELRLEVSNGRTLCFDCHKSTPTYGNRKNCVASSQEA